jgi:hypothetical protein
MAGFGTKNPMGGSQLGGQIKSAVQKSPLGGQLKSLGAGMKSTMGQVKSAVQKSPLGGQIKSAVQKSPLGGQLKSLGAGMKSTMGQVKGNIASAAGKVRARPKPEGASVAADGKEAAFNTLLAQNAKKRTIRPTPEQQMKTFMNSRSNLR